MHRALFLSLLALSLPALAEVQLRVVGDYLAAGRADIWRDVPADTVPPSLIRSATMAPPSHSYAALFPGHFYQEETFVVCQRDCAHADPLVGGVDERTALEQQNVYHWLSRFLRFAQEELQIAPAAHLRVMTGRLTTPPNSDRVMRNNAFFHPGENSLSFLTASDNPLFNLLAGKINRSGFDPSVIAHEAGHSLFNALFPAPVNKEMHGFNEGFADYLANVFLGTPKVGLVMLRGRVLRDSSAASDTDNKVKSYRPGLEVHDLGERFAAVLWKSRQLAPDARAFDQMVIRALQETAQNPWATAHSYKRVFLALAAHELGDEFVTRTAPFWEMHLAGSDKQVEDLTVLRAPLPALPRFSLRRTAVSADRDGSGVVAQNQVFHLHAQRWTPNRIMMLLATHDDSQAARWVAIDPERANVLGAWDRDGALDASEEARALSAEVAQRISLEQSFKTFATAAAQLLRDRGDLAGQYKILGRSEVREAFSFAGGEARARVLRLRLERKLASRLFRIALSPLIGRESDIETLQIYLLPAPAGTPSDWPRVGTDVVVGIGAEFKDDSSLGLKLENLSF